MLNKLAWRNMKRSAGKYEIYLVTMGLVTALIYAFNCLLFLSLDGQLDDDTDIAMRVMVIIALCFVIWIVAWLIHYMVQFMLRQKSREFAIYMLSGMTGKKIAGLYLKENFLLGIVAFFPGLVAGIVIQQLLFSVLYRLIGKNYALSFRIYPYALLITGCCYVGCYLLALFRCRRKIKKTQIADLLHADDRPETGNERFAAVRRLLLPVAAVLLIFCGTGLSSGWILHSGLHVLIFLSALVASIYLFYIGLSAWIFVYIRKKKNGIYHGTNLFLLRQFSAKMRSLQITFGSMTALFTLAILGFSLAMMLQHYENEMLEQKLPFSISMQASSAKEDFSEPLKIIQENATLLDHASYSIYENNHSGAGLWLSKHTSSGRFLTKMDKIDHERADSSNDSPYYYHYDHCMTIHDYNRLRRMLGKKELILGDDQFLIKIKPRLKTEAADLKKQIRIKNPKTETLLQFGGYIEEEFGLDGQDGTDYLIIIPDAIAKQMHIYSRRLVVQLSDQTATSSLQQMQTELMQWYEEQQKNAKTKLKTDLGTDVISFGSSDGVDIAGVIIPEAKYIFSSIVFPLIYVAIVFVLVGLAVMAVQQLSDAQKYRFRYDILSKTGVNEPQMQKLIFWQLFWYYICPILLALVLSFIIVIFISSKFVLFSGVSDSAFSYFAVSGGFFFGIYAFYFAFTWIGFCRNLKRES